MDDAIKMLCDAIRDSGARMTMDRRRSIALPCWRCETADVPRTLVEIGRYTRAVGGGNLPGDKIERPMCPACVAAIGELAIAASQAVAPLDPVPEVVWSSYAEGPDRWYANVGPIDIDVDRIADNDWRWVVVTEDVNSWLSGGHAESLDAAKAAAIAAARAWRDSIRL